MAETCKTCRSWDISDGRTKFGKCLVSSMGYDTNPADLLPDRACSMPDGCEVRTGPDFGCIHWEGR